ncbi:hypothetical protein ACTJIJ_11765 [Niabella sp. 22666]|uniref:hypothetical protein n=1 Tax=Niabella sp. 22666 TaxID=3453954 RepID=UPI003F86E41E
MQNEEQSSYSAMTDQERYLIQLYRRFDNLVSQMAKTGKEIRSQTALVKSITPTPDFLEIYQTEVVEIFKRFKDIDLGIN